jgi:hypothetical protein
MEPLARKPLDRTPPRRPVMDGIVRPTPPRQVAPTGNPSINTHPTPHSPSAHSTAPHQHAAVATHPHQKHPAPDRPYIAPQAANLNLEPLKPHKSGHPTAHAGLVGFIAFLIIGSICLAPVLPGKIWQSAPGSTDSFSTGDQNLDCLSTLGSVATTVHTDHKIGFPITYSYAATTQQSATCEGQTIHAVVGHTAQINPLGLLIDLALALAVAIITAKIWRKLRTAKD